jgi:DNA-binding NarL/FixJ family response regulator
MIRILLVDDQPGVRQGLHMRLALEPDVAVVGEADDGATALRLVESLHPDVVVMDVVMSGMDGNTATMAMHRFAPATPVVILSLYDDPESKKRALDAGAAAFVGKCEAEEVLPSVIRSVAGG